MLALLSVAMMVLDHRENYMDSIRSLLSVIVYPIQSLVDLPRESGYWLSENITARQALQEENTSLHAQELLMKFRLQKLETLKAENSRLRQLLDSSSKVEERVIIAELLSVDMAPFSRRVILNKGSLDGVYVGQAILDADGILGQIVRVSPITSTAMLITDPSHALPVAVNRNSLRAIALGGAKSNRLTISHIPNNADIKVGDLLITSGLGGRFPAGYPVAIISEIKRNPDLPFAIIYAEPIGNLESSREVLIAWTAPEANSAPVALSSDPTTAEQDE